MAQIIAAHLQLQEQIAQVVEELVKADFERGQITSFYFNPPGQHNVYPIGGDRDQSPGAKETNVGIAYGVSGGGAVGAAIGLAGVPALGPIAPILGAVVGAHVGSLVGSLSEMKEKNENETGNENVQKQRKAGMIVAVSVGTVDQQTNAIDILRAYGAEDLERCEGDIIDGEWRDFDPLLPPQALATSSRV